MSHMLRIMTIGLLASTLLAGCATTDSVFVSPSKPHGIMEFKVPDPSYNPVRLLQINDENVAGSDYRRTSFWVKPGTYTVKLAIATGALQTAGRGTGNKDPSHNTFEMTIEDGKRYRIAGKMTSTSANPEWEPVVWAVEDL